MFDAAKKGQAGAQTQKIMNSLSNSNFANALKIGYLFKRAESFFTTWREEFCVLTNVGLLYYNDPNGRPHNLFPIIDSDIKPIPDAVSHISTHDRCLEVQQTVHVQHNRIQPVD